MALKMLTAVVCNNRNVSKQTRCSHSTHDSNNSVEKIKCNLAFAYAGRVVPAPASTSQLHMQSSEWKANLSTPLRSPTGVIYSVLPITHKEISISL